MTIQQIFRLNWAASTIVIKSYQINKFLYIFFLLQNLNQKLYKTWIKFWSHNVKTLLSWL